MDENFEGQGSQNSTESARADDHGYSGYVSEAQGMSASEIDDQIASIQSSSEYWDTGHPLHHRSVAKMRSLFEAKYKDTEERDRDNATKRNLGQTLRGQRFKDAQDVEQKSSEYQEQARDHQAQEAIRKCEEDLKTMWGTVGFHENMSLVSEVVRDVLTQAQRDYLDQSGYGNSPAVAKALLELGKALGIKPKRGGRR
jgi:hypothetical protein